MDFRTILYRSLEELEQPTSGRALDQMVLALRDAIKDLEREEYSWTLGDFSFLTIINQQRYIPGPGENDLPEDFLRVKGDRLGFRIGGDANQEYRLERLQFDSYEETDRWWGTHNSESYGWRDFGGGIEIVPAPNKTGHQIVGPYHKKLTALEASTDGATWSFTVQGYGDYLDWESDWFDEGERMVITLGQAKYSTVYLKDEERASTLLALSHQQRGLHQKSERDRTKRIRTNYYLGDPHPHIRDLR